MSSDLLAQPYARRRYTLPLNFALPGPRMHDWKHATIWMLLVGFSNGRGESVDYTRDVKPILKAKCYACHGAVKKEGNLRLDTAVFALKGGYGGPTVHPEKSKQSPLIVRITESDPALRMPAESQPLSPAEVAILKSWIDAGARAPKDEIAAADPKTHWAFRVPHRPPLTPADDSRSNVNPIDRLLAADHQNRGLTPSPQTDGPTLLRRVYLDLIGLPPTREQMLAFESDGSPTAYENVVDRLLASPQHGERWARHWMDIWRYSDWYGRRSVPDNLNSYGQIWRWRDWIVRSLNGDRGYDRMIVEMLAADEVCPTEDDNLVATGFLVRNFYRWNYNQWMRDNVEHTAKAFLGLTMNCCHCHDHKYDPITQEDYFRMRAFFEPLQIRHDRVPGEIDPGPFEKYVYGKAYKPIETGAVRIFDETIDAKTLVYTGGDERNKTPNRRPVEPGVPVALTHKPTIQNTVSLPAEVWYPGLRADFRNEKLAKRVSAIAEAQSALTKSAGHRSRLPHLQLAVAYSDLFSLQACIAADDVVHRNGTGDRATFCRAAAKAERQHLLNLALLERERAQEAVAAASADKKNAASLVALQARLKHAGEKVDAAEKISGADSTSYQPISAVYPKTSSGRRTALANWIASTDNPLTARVAVNYLWNWHFGRPLVETTENFGISGKRPSHPELLDWLAVELMANGWKMKPLHRLIVTSQAFRMQSNLAKIATLNLRNDPDNRFLWRFPVQRMAAEVLRDSVLAAAGQLDPTIGGKEIPHEQGQTSRRRSIYLAHHGESSMQFLEMFDVPSACDAYRRTTSIMPQQALAMSNSQLLLDQSRVLADLLWNRSAMPSSDPHAEFIQRGFEQILNRKPSDKELAASRTFLGRQTRLLRESKANIEQTRPALNLPQIDPAVRARRDFVLALFNHNDFVTIR